MGWPIRHERQRVLDDFEAMALVERDVGAVGRLQVAVDAIAIGQFEHRREQPATDPHPLRGRRHAHGHEVPVAV